MTANDESSKRGGAPRPLDGMRVLELGQLIAGPFAGCILAYFGASVTKIEPPSGDPLRNWRLLDETGTSYWWRSLARNKTCVTLDLKSTEGQAEVRRLVGECDVLVENFRPGTLEGWGLSPEALQQQYPSLIVARVSGYGQDGPYANKPGFASVCEALGGLRYVNGVPGEKPVRPNLSAGDTLAGLHAALGILLAWIQREKDAEHRGQVIDAAIYESVFNLMEGVVPEFSGAGAVREPSGSTVTGIVPTNTYRCRDGKDVVIGGNGDRIYRSLMHAVGRPDLAEAPDLKHNAGRVAREAEIDAAIERWTASLEASEVLAILERERVPAGPIYSVADMASDPHFRARGMFEPVETPTGTLEIPAIPPKLSRTPGRTEWAGQALPREED